MHIDSIDPMSICFFLCLLFRSTTTTTTTTTTHARNVVYFLGCVFNFCSVITLYVNVSVAFLCCVLSVCLWLV